MIKPYYIECDIYIIFDCILKSTQRRSPNQGETRLLMRTKRTNLPRRPSEVEVVQPVSQIWMTTIQKAKVRSSKVKFVHRNEWSCFFINGWVRIQKIVALLFLTKLVLSIHENDICRIVPLLNFLLTFFGEERKKKKEKRKKGDYERGYIIAGIYLYINVVKIWLCHYYFLEVILQIPLSLCSESCLCVHFF